MSCDNIKMLVLCEGYTDQLFISKYIINKQLGYGEVRSEKPRFRLKKYDIDWLKNNYGEYVGIIQNTGNDYSDLLNLICCRKKMESSTIECICIVTDHDDQSTEKKVQDWLCETMKKNDFVLLVGNENSYKFKYKDSYDKEGDVDVSLIFVPWNETGAIETLMLNAMSSDKPEKESVIEYANHVIDDFKSDNYLTHRRERVKAKMGVAYSIFEPERGVKSIKSIISDTEWNDLKEVDVQFVTLIDVLK